jgi:hypothetical protein
MINLTNKEQSARRDLYCNLMLEVKRRIKVVKDVDATRFGLPNMIAFELCYLQFRLIAELIALASLTAHGDIPATRSGRLTKAYQADAILNALEKLHPDFYPTPGRQVRGNVNAIVLITSGFMTKRELIALYHECGDLLHRGTLRGLKERTPGDFAKIVNTANKIMILLNRHQIQLIDPDYQLWVVMESDQDGRVHAGVMKKAGLAQPR